MLAGQTTAVAMVLVMGGSGIGRGRGGVDGPADLAGVNQVAHTATAVRRAPPDRADAGPGPPEFKGEFRRPTASTKALPEPALSPARPSGVAVFACGPLPAAENKGPDCCGD